MHSGLDNSLKREYSIVVFKMIYARVLELADKHVSEACVARRTGSTPVSRTIWNLQKRLLTPFFLCRKLMLSRMALISVVCFLF